jgi:uncharacterized OsmC-like protein
VTGEVELDGNVLVIKRIHVVYKLRAPKNRQVAIKRVHNMHADHCPVARSLKGAIAISTSLELVD